MMSELSNAEIRNLLYTYRPVEWAHDIIQPAAGITLDEWQNDFLRDTDDRLLLLVHRQGGKSTAVGIKALHRALFRAKQTIVIVSPTQRQSSEMLRSIRNILMQTQYAHELTIDNVMTMEFRNQSRIISLPGTGWNIRGLTSNLVIVDEAAGVPDQIFAAVSPMLLTTHGQFIILSTPQNKTGEFYKAYVSEIWRKYTIKASDNPRMLSPENQRFLQTELMDRGSRIYNQEYECEFLDDMDVGRIKRQWWHFYNVDDIENLRSRSSDIYISWDTASKIKELNDFSVGTVWLRIRENHYLLEMICEKMLFPDLVRTAINLNNKYRPTYNLIEDKSSGTALIQQLRETRPNMPIKAMDPGDMDKGQRLDIATPAIEGGHVFLPASVVLNGANEILVPTSTANSIMDNMAQFPEGEHDDITDSCTQYLCFVRSFSNGYHVEFF